MSKSYGPYSEWEGCHRDDKTPKTDLSEVAAYVDVVFDGQRSNESWTMGRFVEVEDASGKSIGDFGKWIRRPDGYWVLRVPDHRRMADRVKVLEEVLNHHTLTRALMCLRGIGDSQGWPDVVSVADEAIAIRGAALATKPEEPK